MADLHRGMLRRMSETRLPVDAARGDARHRDVRELVFAAVPQRRTPLAKRAFWRMVLAAARWPAGLKALRRIKGS
jgi:hypothetical protein